MDASPFDQAIALTTTGPGRYSGQTHPGYANMVGPFGGVTAATALNAVLQHPALLGEPVSLTVNFCAALADGAFDVIAEPSRTNRSTQHWAVSIEQAGQTVLTATAITAVRRSTWGVQDERMPAALAAHHHMAKAHLLERLQRKLRILALRFLKADHVRFLGGDKAFYIRRAQPHGKPARSDPPAADRLGYREPVLADLAVMVAGGRAWRSTWQGVRPQPAAFQPLHRHDTGGIEQRRHRSGLGNAGF